MSATERETSAGAGETSETRAGVRVRPARADDAAFIIPLVPRLAEFGRRTGTTLK